ncbi:MAG: putative bifunctional diguanylate cyclase/phosphodiesterase [Fluviibacter sp.]
MTESLRTQIQNGFSRVVIRYAILSASLLVTIISIFVLYITQKNLLAQSDLVRTQLKSEISATLMQADNLIDSPILWTGLMDSFSQETVLEPLFKQLNRENGIRFILLDYKGRVSIDATGVDTESLDIVRASIPTISPDGISVQLRKPDNSQDLLLTLMPVMSPLSDAPIGYLMTQFSVTASLKKLSDRLPLEFSFNLEPKFNNAEWLTLNEQYRDTIDGNGYNLSYDTRYSTSLLPELYALGGLITLIVLSGLFLFRKATLWLAEFSAQLTRQLDQLVNYARDIFAGKPLGIELVNGRNEDASRIDASSDEVRTVVRTLESLLEDQAISQEKLRKLAYEDTLTGFPIYQRFLKSLSLRLNTQDKPRTPLMLICIDINKLKHVNDIYGYEVGNSVIKETSQILSASLPNPHLLTRRSSDEFVAWVEMDDQALDEFTARVSHLKINYQNIQIPITLTMGAARYPEDATNQTDLIFCAEYAHNEAKRRARRSFVIFDHQLGEKLVRNKQIEVKIASALRHCEIKPFYQPEINMLTGEISGFEALARWHDSELGWITPNEFLPIVEHLRLSSDLTQCLLGSILQDITKIRQRFPRAKIAFNASPADFHGNQLIETIESYASRQPDGLAGFELELTEQNIVDLDIDMMEKLNQVIKSGMRVAIDDFGTRYSSLSRLADLPLHRLKIDASFVSNIGNKRGKEIIRLIISLARTMELDLTAEGVESIKQRDLLIELGCSHGQGWLYHKAVSLVEVLELPQIIDPVESAI